MYWCESDDERWGRANPLIRDGGNVQLEIWRRLLQIGGHSSFIGALQNRCFVQIAAVIRPNSNAVNAPSAHIYHLSVAPNVLQTFRRTGFASVAQLESNHSNNQGRVRI